MFEPITMILAVLASLFSFSNALTAILTQNNSIIVNLDTVVPNNITCLQLTFISNCTIFAHSNSSFEIFGTGKTAGDIININSFSSNIYCTSVYLSNNRIALKIIKEHKATQEVQVIKVKQLL